MRFRLDHEIPWPPDVVLATWRDRPGRLAAYLPHVDRVEGLTEGATTFRRWWLDPERMPGPLTQRLPANGLAIDEHVIWGTMRAAVRLVPTRWPDALEVAADLQILAEGDGTLLVLDGALTLRRLPGPLADIDPDRVAGWLVGLIPPRFSEICRATTDLLDDEA